ncbi:MAG: hypothetical protein JSV96_17030 [Candidatus Aminicenantes bacterium]|nr:MAG: hypothetical protein JSV96_17030 [Candidatus Aminicenantes bacterium]
MSSSNGFLPPKKIVLLFSCLLCLIAPLYYAYLITVNTVNAPRWDDYDSIVNFFNLFMTSDSIAHKVSLILHQHNEHRLGFARLISVIVFYLKGSLDFTLLCYIGNAALVFIAFFLFRAFKIVGRYKLLLFSPVLFFLFQPQYFDTLLWPTVLLSNFYVFLFALLVLILLCRKNPFSFFIACILAGVATYTQGNGFLVLAVGLIVVLMQGDRKKSVIWLSLSVLILVSYFSGYKQLPGQTNVFHVFMNLRNTVLYGFCFIGSAAGFFAYYPSFAFGILIVLYFLFLTIIKYFKNNPVIYFLFLFILLTVGLNTVFRSGRGVEYVLAQPRYKFIGVSFLILTYLSLYEIMQKKKKEKYVALVGLLVASGFFFASSYNYTPDVIRNSETLRRGLLSWYVDGTGLFYPYPVKANLILNKASNNELYRIPEKLLQEFSGEPHIFDEKDFNKKLRFSIAKFAENADYIYIDGWAHLINAGIRNQEILIIFKSSDHIFAVPTHSIKRPDVAAIFKSAELSHSGFGVLIKKSLLQPGRYQIGLYVEHLEDSAISFTERYIEIER